MRQQEVQFLGGMEMSDGELITVGRIVKPFGVRGQVRVHSLTDVPGRLEHLKDVILVLPSGRQVETTVTEVKIDGRSHLLKFSAFSTPEEAKGFGGAYVTIPRGNVPPAPEGQWYQFELIGLTAKDPMGATLGIVSDVLDLPGQQMFVVKQADKEWLIPASHRWVTNVDIAGQTMTVVYPEEWSER